MAGTDKVNPKTFSILTLVAAAAIWLVFAGFVMMSDVASAERVLKDKQPENVVDEEVKEGFFIRVIHFFWQGGKSAYQHVWPVSIHLSYVCTYHNWHFNN